MSSTGPAEPRAGLGEALAAEWVKLRGARSATWTLAAMAACLVGVAALVGATRSLQPDDTVLGGSLTGAVPALLVAASFGALAMSGEYASGTIRVTLAACPRRGVVLAAKAMVVGAVLFGVGLAACLLAWRVGAAMLPDGYAPGSPVPALAGVALCFSATGLLGLAAGTVLRHSAAAIPTMVTTLLLPTLVGPLLGGWGRWVAGASPVAALQKLAQSSDAAPGAVGSLGAWPSLGLVAPRPRSPCWRRCCCCGAGTPDGLYREPDDAFQIAAGPGRWAAGAVGGPEPGRRLPAAPARWPADRLARVGAPGAGGGAGRSPGGGRRRSGRRRWRPGRARRGPGDRPGPPPGGRPGPADGRVVAVAGRRDAGQRGGAGRGGRARLGRVQPAGPPGRAGPGRPPGPPAGPGRAVAADPAGRGGPGPAHARPRRLRRPGRDDPAVGDRPAGRRGPGRRPRQPATAGRAGAGLGGRAGPDRPRAPRRGRPPHVGDRHPGRGRPYRPPEEAAGSFATIRATATEGLAELRRVVGVLRADDLEDHDPQPTLERLDELVANGRAAGLTLTTAVTGAPRALPAGVELSAYRIVQEALSNAARHAPRSQARVEIAYRPAGLELRIVNGPARGRPAPSSRPGPGFGVAGMRERAVMLGGELAAGPRPDGGYAVEAVLPVARGRPPVIRVLLADDQARVREGFSVLLGAQPGIEVVGEAVDGRDAVDQAAALRPDVVLMDVRMPVLDGLAATRLIVGHDPTARVLVVTTFDLDEYVYEALRAGASGFVLKDASAQALAEAVRVVAAGDAMLAPSVTRRLLGTFARLGAPRPGPNRAERLTERESEVLTLVARGCSNAEIAERLVVAEQTVKTHMSRILAKLGLRDRAQAAIFAFETGLVGPGD